jgi:hypothetical protein
MVTVSASSAAGSMIAVAWIVVTATPAQLTLRIVHINSASTAVTPSTLARVLYL